MKLKKVITLCKSSGRICLFTAHDLQWISDGFGMYPLYGFPQFDLESLCATFDISEKAQEKICLCTEPPFSVECFDLSMRETGEQCAKMALELCEGKSVYRFVRTSEGIVAFDISYLSPFDGDVNFEFYEKKSKDGLLYFEVRQGLGIMGVIRPGKPTKDMITEMAEICKNHKKGDE